MANNTVRFIVLICFLALLMPGQLYAQSTEQKDLEAKREKLQNEIREINRLLFSEKKYRGSVLDQIAALDKKIHVRQNLISVTNQQSNYLTRKINLNIKKIGDLRDELKVLKNEYAVIIEKSYQKRSQQSKLMFLLSSKNFFEAFKRFQYMKQYTQYRKDQGVEIISKTDELARLNKDLNEERKVKEVLLVQNRKARKTLVEENKIQKELLATLKANESNYLAQIEEKEKEAKKIDRQIEKLIRAAIAEANEKNTDIKASSADNSRFYLTPEAAIIANNFTANKGSLIWPVEKGIKSQGFGVYSDAVYPGIKHESNGVIIATDKGTRARAIFKGEVIAILSIPGGKKGVQIKHGNFISTYFNLSVIFVNKGDEVDLKQEIGTIFTNQDSGQTLLKFYLFEDTNRLNPEEWVYQL